MNLARNREASAKAPQSRSEQKQIRNVIPIFEQLRDHSERLSGAVRSLYEGVFAA